MVELKHGKEYFSPSQLKKLFVSLGAFNGYLKKVWDTTSSMELGTLIHHRLLEPEVYREKYITIDDADIKAEIGGARPTSTKKYKEWRADAEAEAKKAGKTIISEFQDHLANKIYRQCTMSGIYDEYFTGGEAEKTVRGGATGFNQEFEALCIVDYLKDEFAVDLKTTSKPIDKFKFDANSLGYDIQAALTTDLTQREFVFVVVQTVEPYDIAVFRCSEEFYERGDWKINKALENYEMYENEHSSQILYGEL